MKFANTIAVCFVASAALPSAHATKGNQQQQRKLYEPCQPGYTYEAGDIPGWGKINGEGGGAIKTAQECADLCDSKASCQSYEHSPTTNKCNLNTARAPTQGVYQDFAFCMKDGDCEPGYTYKAGDVPGWSKIDGEGGGAIKTAQECAALCNSKSNCLSYEHSATTKKCNLNTLREPTQGVFQDYDFCMKDVTPSGSASGDSAPSGSASGDPHFKTFAGEKFDFHGECDLILLHNPDFANGLGMDIHIRTKIWRYWSFIESAVLRIGDSTLEITGDKSKNPRNHYWVNGNEGPELSKDVVDSFELAGFTVNYRHINDHQHQFYVNLDNKDAIKLATFKEFVSVDVKGVTAEKFSSSIGLMGSYPKGLKLGRDGATSIEDDLAYGMEWQVKDQDPLLFHEYNDDIVQFPAQCKIPEQEGAAASEKRRRRLGEAGITQEQAAIACSRVNEADRDACIFDVLATNDLDMAGSY